MIGARRFFVAAEIILRSVSNRVSERCSAFAGAGFRQFAHGFVQHALHVGGVAIQILDDLAHRDRIVLRMPAIVVGDHGDRGVANFRFARELGFGQIGHADYVEAQLAIAYAIRPAWKIAGLPCRRRCPRRCAFTPARSQASAMCAERCVQVGLSNPTCATMPPPKKVAMRPPGAIEKLIGDQKIQRRQVVAQRAYRADGNDAFDAEHFHRADVGAVVDVARRIHVAAAVTREKCHALPFQRADDDCVGGIAERSLHADFARIGEAGHGIEAAAADDADLHPFDFSDLLDLAAAFFGRFAACAIFNPPLPARLPRRRCARARTPPAFWYRGKTARSSLP